MNFTQFRVSRHALRKYTSNRMGRRIREYITMVDKLDDIVVVQCVQVNGVIRVVV